MNWLKKIGRFFRELFSRETADAIERGIEAAVPYIRPALELVKIIAALAPTRANDEIVRLIERYAVPIVLTPGADRGAILRQIAVAELQKRFPEVPERVLNRALEIAYGAIRP